MKKIILLLILALAFTGCSLKNETDNKAPAKASNSSPADIEIAEEIPVDYEVESIVLSKGYQSIEPHVEILDKSQPPKFLVSLGLIECSGIFIDRVTKSNNEISIYTNKVMQDGKNHIVVPQLTIQIKNLNVDKLEDLKFNIIGANYKPINLKYDKTHVLNKIYAEYKLTSNTIPNVNIVRDYKKYIWDIDLNNVFDTCEYKFPIVNFKAQVDAMTGEIISTDKTIISQYLSEGNVLDYDSQKRIVYKTEEISKDIKFETLWSLKTNKNEISKIYTTHNSIYTAKSSPDGNHIALIENSNGITDLYLINLANETIQKITPANYNHTWNIVWSSNNLLYCLNNDSKEKSTLFSYDIKENKHKKLSTFPKILSNMVANKQTIIFEEYDEKNKNKNIYMFNDKEGLVKIDNGFNIMLLGTDKIAYLKNSEKTQKNFLYFYDIKTKSKITKSDADIKSFKSIDDNSIILIKTNYQDSNFSIFEYNVNNDKTEEKIIDTISEDVYYDKESGILYINIIPPVDGIDKNSIYEIKVKEKVS